MPRTVAGLRTEDRLPRTGESVEPDWGKWIDLVALAVAEAEEPAWAEAVAVPEQRPIGAPLLHGASLRIPADSGSTFVVRLADQMGIVALAIIDPTALIRAGIERDWGHIETLAAALAVPADTVALLGQLSAMPLLLNSAHMLSPEDARTWQRGYCPVCGAWPSMIEMRGIQRERRMRCGCCAGDWLLPVLRCAFCDEMDHQKLASFSNEGQEHRVRVETCSTCRGYLKSLTTLSALPFATLAERDLSTVAFDLAAADRGYARPARPGWQVHVEIRQ